MKTRIFLLALCLGLAVFPIQINLGRDAGVLRLAAHAAEDMAAETLAAQIRIQGYPCDKASSAQRDVERSRPDSAVWILKCDNATYRIRLDPDMAAKVEKIQ
jgi:hypothetical protein